MDERIMKIPFKRERTEGYPLYPYCFLRHTPPQECVFDSWRGTVGFDIFPFAVTTRIASAAEVYLKVYEEQEIEGGH